MALEVLASAIWQEKTVKGIQIRKEESKLSLLTDGIIVYKEQPDNSIKMILELIRKAGNVAVYKISEHKPMSLVYTNSFMVLKKKPCKYNPLYKSREESQKL